MRRNPRCSLWAGMGIGKSSASLFALELMRLSGDLQGPTLVIGPARVARDTWPDEVAKWEQFRHTRIVPLVGTPAERARLLNQKADIYTVSYELAPWLVSHFMERWPFKQVIADESDRLKGFREKSGGVSIKSKNTSRTGKRAHSLGMVAHNLTDRWVNLTGTPSPNGLKDLWGQQWYVDRGARLGRTYSAFMQRWFKPRWSGFGVDPMPHAEKEIHGLLGDVCLTVDPKDYFDLKDPIVTRVECRLPPKVKAQYKELERQMFLELSDAKVEAFNAAALTNKCLQFANGAVYTRYPEWIAVHEEKIEAVRSVLAESGAQPILLSYAFKSDLARIKAAFPRAVELSTTQGMRAFRAGDAPIGLAHPKSLGHGIDGLQHCTNIIVNFGHTWNLGERMQMIERIGPVRQMQAGLDRPVYVYDLVTVDTVDEDVMAAYAAKRTVQDQLLLAMKRRAA